VVPIEVPPLESRREDIPELANMFLEMFAREQGLARRKLSAGAIAALQTRELPGNVRQLRNMMEQVLIMGGDKDPRVHPGQSLEMYRSVKIRTDTPVRLVIYPGEVHGNRKTAARYDYSLRLVRWMDHYLKGPGGEAPPYELDHASRLEALAEDQL
jgi:DNA-binding NtrC family response regulator